MDLSSLVFTLAQIVVLFYLITDILHRCGYDPINSNSIVQNNQSVSTEDKKRARNIYKSIKSTSTIPQTNSTIPQTNSTIPQTNSTIPQTNSIIDEAEKFVIDYNIVDAEYQKQLIEIEQHWKDAEVCYNKAYTKIDGYSCYLKPVNRYTKLCLQSAKLFVYNVRSSSIVIFLTQTEFANNAKIALLKSYAFGNYMLDNWKTVGGLIGIGVAGYSMLQTYDNFSRQVGNAVEEIDAEIRPFKFDLNNVLATIEDDVGKGGGDRMREGIKTLQNAITLMASTNKDLQEALATAMQRTSVQLSLLHEAREDRNATREDERLQIEKASLQLQQAQFENSLTNQQEQSERDKERLQIEKASLEVQQAQKESLEVQQAQLANSLSNIQSTNLIDTDSEQKLLDQLNLMLPIAPSSIASTSASISTTDIYNQDDLNRRLDLLRGIKLSTQPQNSRVLAGGKSRK
jgi:hypothetical protein